MPRLKVGDIAMDEMKAQTTGEAQGDAATPDQPHRPLATIGGGERIVSLDFIRGVAVLGILAANIVAMSAPGVVMMWPLAAGDAPTGSDFWAWLGTLVVIDGKMRGLFTLLFGAGLYLFMDRVWARGGTLALQARRLAFLFAFGFLHFLFLFYGDILMLYAAWGMLAMVMLRMGAKSQFFIGLSLYIAFGLLLTLFSLFPALSELDPAGCADSIGAETCAEMAAVGADVQADAAAEQAVYGGGSYLDVVSYAVTEQIWFQIQALFMAGLSETLPLMLMGMAILRFGWFDGTGAAGKQLVLGLVAVALGMGGTAYLALWAADSGHGFWISMLSSSQALGHFTNLLSVLGLAAVLGALGASLSKGWLGSRFAAAGRVAFTNYIGTSFVMLFVMQGWAFGLYGELSRTEMLGVVLAAWAVMLAWSKPWLDRYRYGPLEWLWRCLTYGRLFPLRR